MEAAVGDDAAATEIRIAGVGRSFSKGGTRRFALRDLDLDIGRGSFVALLGRSGCGKSTLLNMVAGLSEPDEGTIRHARHEDGTATKLGYLTQHDTLLPWRTVRANVALPLEIERRPTRERDARTSELIEKVRLRGFEDHYPRELSGGMRRRTSLARMLCPDPAVLLLDEPFGALDAQLRRELQAELLELWQGTGKTVVFVTHDVDEALCLGDRVVVLGSGGRVLLDRAVALPRPRDLDDIRVDPEFVSTYREITHMLRER